MKRILQSTCWVLLGAVVGALATGRILAQGRPTTFPQPLPAAEQRLIYIPVNLVEGGYLKGDAAFIRDTKSSDGCWLQVRTADNVMLAPAPSFSCTAK
jgi:hypothetical protein